MKSHVVKKSDKVSLTQFSIYAANRVGRLNDILSLLGSKDVHVMAICTIDTNDNSIIRMVVDDPSSARELLEKNRFPFNEIEVMGVQLDSESKLKAVTRCLVQAEINIHYIYSFLVRPHGKSGIVVSLEDNDLASEVLAKHDLKVITEDDIIR